jgi:hypothetical protein
MRLEPLTRPVQLNKIQNIHDALAVLWVVDADVVSVGPSLLPAAEAIRKIMSIPETSSFLKGQSYGSNDSRPA